MYKNFSLKVKISLLVGAAFAILITILGVIYSNQSRVEEYTRDAILSVTTHDLKEQIKLGTDSVASVLGELVKGLDEETQIKVIQKSLQDFRFLEDKSGYYGAYKKYTTIAHPIRPDMVGKSQYDTKDNNGVYWGRDLYEVSLKGGGFVNYGFDKPQKDGTLVFTPKIAYAAPVPNAKDMWIFT